MQLGEQAEEFRKRGYGVAALTYDSVKILRHFSERMSLDYTLLSDPESRVIRAFGILNEDVPKDHAFYGVPHPGMYVIDAAGTVRANFFEEKYQERYTPATVLHFLDSKTGLAFGTLETDHLKVTLSASDRDVRPGNRTTLTLAIELKPGMHVYAPEVEGGYKPIRWEVEASPAWDVHDADFPNPKVLHLPAIKETVPVYEGSFQLSRDLTILPVKSFAGDLVVEGKLYYQACDEKECYMPQEVPLKWTFHGLQLERQRVPEDLRK